MNKSALVLLTVIGSLVTPAITLALSINYDNSSPFWRTDGIVDVGTSAEDMKGMTATVTFSDETTADFTWTESSTTSGLYGFWGTGWSLSIDNGNTYFFTDQSKSFVPWTLTAENNITLTSLFIDSGPGNSVFDVIHSYAGDPSSENGSRSGYAFQEVDVTTNSTNKLLSTDPPPPITVTYSGPVVPAGYAFEGDLYRYMLLEFTEGFSDDTLLFTSDTDTLASSLIVVPEPSTLLLFGTGIGALAGLARKKATLIPAQA